MEKILAIVIPVWNNFQYTKKAIQMLAKLPDNHKIIVVDNGSTDETKLLKSSQNIEIIRNNDNLYFAKACNQGFLSAKNQNYQNVMFLNNDIRVFGNYDCWTAPLIQKAEKGCIVGPTVGCFSNDFSFICEGNKIPSRGYWYLSGWNITASVNTWNKLVLPGMEGPFSTEFVFYFEDFDLGLRAQLQRIPCEIIPVPVKHLGKASSKKLGVSALYTNARQIFIKKWKNKGI